MKLPRHKFLHPAAGAVALPALSRFACAQTYPTRPVRFHQNEPASDTIAKIAKPTVETNPHLLG
jgi:hypothetical protein